VLLNLCAAEDTQGPNASSPRFVPIHRRKVFARRHFGQGRRDVRVVGRVDADEIGFLVHATLWMDEA